MSTPSLRVLEPGILTTVQDLGRNGFGRFGVPPSGALDADALRLVNILLGNSETAAGLEITFQGPILTAEGDVLVAVAGGRFGPAPGRVQELRSGSLLDLRGVSGDPRGVLAVAGGFDVPLVLGSRSTCLPGRFGGLEGRPLARGDVLPVAASRNGRPPSSASIPEALLPSPPEPLVLRVILGPHAELLAKGSLGTFFTARYRLLPESNRIGFRLEGPAVANPPEGLPSEAVLTGAIQVPPSGQPIVLMNDRPTTGGYPKIGTVVEAERGLLTRARPGQLVAFAPATLEEARVLLERKEERIQEWARSLGKARDEST